LKRSAIDVIRRGFDNALANWPLILIRIAEGVLFGVIVVGAIIAAVIPLLVSAGLSRDIDYRNPENVAQLLVTLFIEHWILVLYILALFLLILGVLMAIHSFVEAGCARIYIDGERVAGLRAFAVDRWLRGGVGGWWAVFWIYNLAWSAGALILLGPLVLTMVGMLAVSAPVGRVAIGCVGLAVTFLLFLPTAILIGMWTQKAIVVCVARTLGAVEALRAAKREIKLDFGRHFAVALVLIVISFITAAVISGMSFPFSFGQNRNTGLFPLFFAPVQIAISLVQSIASAAIHAWSLASFVALTEERP
jgi:hypothetical protein